VIEFSELGRMQPSGIEAFERKSPEKSSQYACEQGEVQLSKEYQRKLQSNSEAWAFFQSLAPSYQKPSIYWVMNAKKAETRLNRLKVLIDSSAAGLKIPRLRRENKK